MQFKVIEKRMPRCAILVRRAYSLARSFTHIQAAISQSGLNSVVGRHARGLLLDRMTVSRSKKRRTVLCASVVLSAAALCYDRTHAVQQ